MIGSHSTSILNSILAFDRPNLNDICSSPACVWTIHQRTPSTLEEYIVSHTVPHKQTSLGIERGLSTGGGTCTLHPYKFVLIMSGNRWIEMFD